MPFQAMSSSHTVSIIHHQRRCLRSCRQPRQRIEITRARLLLCRRARDTTSRTASNQRLEQL